MSGVNTVRAAFCRHDDRPATVEIAYIAQNSGPGVSSTACPECAEPVLKHHTASGPEERP